MSIRNIGLSLFLGMGLVLLGAQAVQAQTITDVENEIIGNVQTVMDVINEPFSKSMGLFSTLGWNTSPAVFDLVAGPRIEIGVGVGAQLMNLPDLGSLSSMGVTVLPGDVGLDIPTFIPIPFPVATGRIGLMNGLDAGLKVAYFPEVNIPEIGFAAGFTGIGVELRYKFIQGDLLPDVTVAVSYDSMQGSISVATDVDYVLADYQGSGPVTVQSNTPTSYALDWDLQSFGAKVQVGKNLGALYPYASVGFQRHSGTVSSTFDGDFQVDFNGSTNNNFLINVVSASVPIVFEPKFVGGVDFGEGFIWGLVAESNGIDIAANTNFRLRF